MQDALPLSSLLTALALSYAMVLPVPGPNLVVVLRAGLVSSRQLALLTALGVATGAALLVAGSAVGASLLPDTGAVRAIGSVVFAAFLLRAAAQLFAAPARWPGGRPQRSTGAGRDNFVTGVVVALCNPLTVPFFLSFFLAYPGPRNVAMAATCAVIVFAMAALWFGALGIAVARLAARRGFSAAGVWFRRALGIVLLVYAIFAVADVLTLA